MDDAKVAQKGCTLVHLNHGGIFFFSIRIDGQRFKQGQEDNNGSIFSALSIQIQRLLK